VWQRLDWLIRFVAIWFVVRTIVFMAERLFGSGFGPVATVTLDIADAIVIMACAIRMVVRIWEE
jgi:hypothetical protein